MTILSHDHQDAMMMQEYEGTNNTITNGYKSKTFTSTLYKQGDLVKIVTQQNTLDLRRKMIYEQHCNNMKTYSMANWEHLNHMRLNWN